ncbi:mechanosensitive ion channel family protein [Enterococcus sp. LJL98]
MLYLLTTDSTDTNIIEPAARQLNALQRWWNTINWEEILGILIQKALAIVLISFLFFLLNRLANFIIQQMFKKYRSNKFSEVRLTTLRTLVLNITHYTLAFFYLYALLAILGVPIGSLIAGAGIAGIAIGLGAQGFMNDLITGFFIIFEQQIDVGDYITLKDLGIEGTVTAVGLRILEMQSIDGTIHFIPNRSITTISNASRGDRRVVVDVRIVPTENLEEIKKLIAQANEEISAEEENFIKIAPEIFGMVDLGNGNYAIRTTLYVQNGKQALIQQKLLTRSISLLTAAGYTIPNTPITVI